MIAMLPSAVWLGMAYATGMMRSALRQLLGPKSAGSTATPVGLLALLTALIAMLMIALCGRHWKKEYSWLGRTLNTLLVSFGIAAVYYGILVLWFWNIIPKA
jgi:hypothetical protein